MTNKTAKCLITLGSVFTVAGCNTPGSEVTQCSNTNGKAVVTRSAAETGDNLIITDTQGKTLHRSQDSRSLGMQVFHAKDFCVNDRLPALAEEKTYAQGYGYSCRGHMGTEFTASTKAGHVTVSSGGKTVASYKAEDIMHARYVTERLCEGAKPGQDFRL